MKGKIFGDIGVLKIQVGGKIWVFDRMTKTELRFKPAPLGGYAGSGNYLRIGENGKDTLKKMQRKCLACLNPSSTKSRGELSQFQRR